MSFEQQLLFAIIILVLIWAIERVFTSRQMLSVIRDASDFASLVRAGYDLAPAQIRAIGAEVETITDIAEDVAVRLFGDGSRITDVAKALEELGDNVLGEGETELDQEEIQ